MNYVPIAVSSPYGLSASGHYPVILLSVHPHHSSVLSSCRFSMPGRGLPRRSIIQTRAQKAHQPHGPHTPASSRRTTPRSSPAGWRVRPATDSAHNTASHCSPGGVAANMAGQPNQNSLPLPLLTEVVKELGQVISTVVKDTMSELKRSVTEEIRQSLQQHGSPQGLSSADPVANQTRTPRGHDPCHPPAPQSSQSQEMGVPGGDTSQAPPSQTSPAQAAILLGRAAIGETIQDITGPGGLSQLDSGQNVNPVLQSLVAPSNCFISEKTKQKIWRDEYVDFDLLVGGDDKCQTKFSISVDPDSDQPAISMSQQAKSHHIVLFRDWAKAFRNYVAIYAQQHPLSTSALMSYAQTMEELCNAGGDWKYYDEHFRRARESQRTPWDVVNVALMTKATLLRRQVHGSLGRGEQSAKKEDKGATSSPPTPFPKGTCWKYHEGRRCDGRCGFDHRCPYCKDRHPASSCKAKSIAPGKTVGKGAYDDARGRQSRTYDRDNGRRDTGVSNRGNTYRYR